MVKKDGKREPFDRGKLERAIGHACRKRDIDASKIDRLVSGIQRQMETQGDEVRTALLQAVGERLGIGDHRLGVGLELRLQRFAEGDRLGGDHVHERPSLEAREDR